jgi:hypothetical protein
MNLTRTDPDLLLDAQSALPENTTLRSFDYSKETGQFLLSCAQPEGGSIWAFHPDQPLSGLHKIATTTTPVKDGVWLNNANNDGWICLSGIGQSNYVSGTQTSSVEPAKLLPDSNIDAITATSDGRCLFFLGTVSNEPSAGIWQYDLDSRKLRCLVSYGDHASAFAKRINFVTNNIVLPSGEKLVCYTYMPANFDDHQTHKYPLIIGNTPFGIVVRGLHGRLWAPTLAACGACVVIIDRPGGWWDGMDQWEDHVMAVCQKLLVNPQIDTNQVFLYGASAETQYTSDLMDKHPDLWKGAILLNPAGLPDFSAWPTGQRRPKILVSAGALEEDDARLESFQEDAVKTGVEVDIVIHPGEGHHLVGNTSQLQRTRAMVNFVFDE